MTNSTLARIEFGRLEARRPRHAGKNARLGDHGDSITVPLARVTASDGATGFGMVRASREQIASLLGASLGDAVVSEGGVEMAWRALEFPLWDLQAKRAGVPVYHLIAPDTFGTPASRQVSCYDTSLYIDDLHLESHDEAAALIAAEAMDGWDRGHRAFKIKVGRGARHMSLDEGTERDILVIRAVREAVGFGARLMIDANNGYNLNLTKRVLHETADCAIYWLEEAFHEDAVLYRDLKEWLAREGTSILIADGEGDASPSTPGLGTRRPDRRGPIRHLQSWDEPMACHRPRLAAWDVPRPRITTAPSTATMSPATLHLPWRTSSMPNGTKQRLPDW